MVVVYGICFGVVYLCSSYLLLSNNYPNSGLKQFSMISHGSVHSLVSARQFPFGVFHDYSQMSARAVVI